MRLAAGDGRQTKPIFTGPSHLSPAFGEDGTLGTNQSQSPTIGASREDSAVSRTARSGVATVSSFAGV